MNVHPAASLGASSARPEAGLTERARAEARDVLIVEDDRDQLRALELLLEDSGWRVRTATTVCAALACLRAAPPTLVVVDLGLGDGSGTAVLAARGGVPALVLSGAPHADAVARAAGAAFLAKPYDVDVLVRELASLARSAAS